jgi:exodeoxyribonuclease-3
MKICTYNVNSIKARKDLVLEWLENRGNDIDVLCFQELKTVDEGFPSTDFEALGYRCLVYGQKAYNGVAICTKIPPQTDQRGFGNPEWDEQKRVISARIGGIEIINLYAPHGGLRGEDKFDYKQNWYRFLLAFLKDHYSGTDPILILGDMNVAHRDIDVYSPEALEDSIGTLPEERKVFQDLLDWDLVDVFRQLHRDKIQFTWWDYIGGAIWKNQGMRIDYILTTKPLVPKIRAIEVDLWPRKRRKPTPSDHAPLVAEVDV